MIAHLNIKANGKDLVLPENFSIDIEDANPLFNDNEMYTFPVSIPMDGNRHLVKDMEAINSDVRAIDVEHTPMQIIVDGVPYRSGVAVVDEAQEIADHFSFSIQSMRESLEDKISDLNCRDIPVKDKIKIGEMIGDVNVELWVNYYVIAYFKELPLNVYAYCSKPEFTDWTNPVEHTFSLQALGFSYPFEAEEGRNHVALHSDSGVSKKKDFINVTNGYSPSTPYCNTRICYKGLKKKDDGSISESVDTNTKFAPYTVLEANRSQSGINFYVLYFLECLFHYLGVSYDISKLEKVEDLKRLFFFNTACKFDTKRKYPQNPDHPNAYDLRSLRDINEWARSRANDPAHCGQLEVRVQEKKDIPSITIKGETYVKDVTFENSSLIGGGSNNLTLARCESEIIKSQHTVQANILNMYANSENFPKESISTILNSLRNSFGIRFLVNQETHSVKAVLMRDIYRSSEAPIQFPCKVISVHKVTEKCTGVRMVYSAESDQKEQRDNVKYGVRDYDTNFDYIDYRNVDSSLSYGSIIQKRSSYDMTTYVDQNTGNAYRLKVDSEAKTLSEMNARLFEVGGYKGLEYGDCSSINEDFVENLVIDWSPMLFTDVNIRHEMSVGQDDSNYFYDEHGTAVSVGFSNPTSREQIFAAYFDEDMLEKNAEVNIDLPMPIDPIDAVLREVLTTDESYDPESTDDGNSPLQSADWGCAVGIMRGGGSDMTLQTYDYDYDGFGNSKWRFVAGSYDSSSDSIDNWGTRYDYDTSEIPGLGGEQFSLKIRAYKNDPETGAPMLYPGVSAEVKNRGLFDTFMSEHAHFLLNRKKYKIVCECEIAALADIPNHWDRRYQIGNIVGWINHISTNVSAKEGLGLVEIEMYSI